MLNHDSLHAILDFVENGRHAQHSTRMLARGRAKARNLLDKDNCLKPQYVQMLATMREASRSGAPAEMVIAAAMQCTQEPRPDALTLYEQYR